MYDKTTEAQTPIGGVKASRQPSSTEMSIRDKLSHRRWNLEKELDEVNQCLRILDSNEIVQQMFHVIAVAEKK